MLCSGGLNPVSSEAQRLFLEGVGHMDEENNDEARIAFIAALELAPDFAEAHGNLGMVQEVQGELAEAELHQRRAIELSPQQPEFHLNLGALLVKQKRLSEAEIPCRQALLLAPNSPRAWANFGVFLACTGRASEAEQSYRTAMAIDPSYRTARHNLAYLLLRDERYDEGWECLEARNMYEPLARQLACPRWQGEPLQDKSLLIGLEMGHGDMIQFCRYARLAKEAGAARVSVVCHAALKTLFLTLDDIDEVIGANESFPASGWDFWTPPMSFPFFFKTRHDSIPARVPYLKAEPDAVRRWAEEISSTPSHPRVGIVWRGNPRFENDADRSLPSPAVLASLADVPGAAFFSLQKGPTAEDERALAAYLPCVTLGHRLSNFAETAAVIENLDLVLTVDTAVAHLAGALGRPCWLLLPAFKTDWRWLLDRDDSPWYPEGMRLFRQQAPGDWAPVLARVVAELTKLTDSTHCR
jgi:Tfp pilus assembly protein PilF